MRSARRTVRGEGGIDMPGTTGVGFGRRSVLALVLLLAVLTAVAGTWALRPGEAEAQEPVAGESVHLYPGGNLVSYLGVTLPVRTALDDSLIYVEAIWYFDAFFQEWLLWSPLLPEALQSFTELVQYNAYFVFSAADTDWFFLFADPLALTSCAEQSGLGAAQGGLFEAFFLIEPVDFVGGAPLVCAVDRVLAGENLEAEAVEAMLAGPTEDERAIGVASRWDDVLSGESSCDGLNFTLEFSGGLATIQFCRTVILTGVVADAIMQAQLNATLMQFADIDAVAILNASGDCLFDLSGLNLCLAATPAASGLNSGTSCISDLRDRPLSDLGDDTAEFFTPDEVVYALFDDLDGDGARERVSQIVFAQNRQMAFYLSDGGCTTYAGTMLGVSADPLATATNGVQDLMTDATCGLAGLCRTLTTWRYDGSRYQPGDEIACLGEASDPASCPIHELVE